MWSLSPQSMILSWAGAWLRKWRSERGFCRLRLMPRRNLRLRLRCSNQTFSQRNPPSKLASQSRLRKSAPSFPPQERAAALQADSRRHRRLHALRAAQGPQQDRVCRRLAHGAADVCGRRAGRRRGRAGAALCGPRRATAQQHDCGHGPQARGGLHRQRGQVPSAGQSHARARRGQHLLAVSLSPDRRGASAGAGGAGRYGGYVSAGRAPAAGRVCAAGCTPFAA